VPHEFADDVHRDVGVTVEAIVVVVGWFVASAGLAMLCAGLAARDYQGMRRACEQIAALADVVPPCV
jgi:hypothetical protein